MQKIDDLYLSRFVYWIREREQIRMLKERGLPRPWTGDPVLAHHHFCNVRRQDDRGTKEIQAAVKDSGTILERLPEVYTIARLLNSAPSVALLLAAYRQAVRVGVGHPMRQALEVLKQRRAAGHTVFHTAYVVSTCGQSMDKLDYIGNVYCGVERLQLSTESCEVAYEELLTVNGLGSFLAGQVVADLKNDRYLTKADDWFTFSVIGPGSKKGLNFLFGGGTTPGNYERRMCLLEAALPQDIADMGIHRQDLQNCLCEFSKYIRYLENLPGRRRSY